jgi:hypothetical protein
MLGGQGGAVNQSGALRYALCIPPLPGILEAAAGKLPAESLIARGMAVC